MGLAANSALHIEYIYFKTFWDSILLMNQQEQLFNDAWRSYKPAIARVVQSYEAIPALQEELQQDIAFAVWRSLPRFNHNSSLKTYILSIAHNRAISHVAKYAKEGPSSSTDDITLKGDDCPSANLEATRKQIKLMTGLQQLPIAQRQILGLALEGLSYDEISEVMGITVNNVGVRLNRAKKALKDAVDSLSE
ncbi:RNA polymerase sigma factor [Pleionea litopenaei]|uniref:Sigma-70 family RNA polymerase sigma factor n=1 Tax=Pleionea litopenaei TaxID=3070815 RepID=A0AA51RT07_9GAMM|nr:sigma-70 family RNA polymerase sigma factor [Pleionea sp. HL-JVS1]WMS86929.1 sigma-70 family RNA polymerase sigma factor [Pleionea sp. HL-JVS1]